MDQALQELFSWFFLFFCLGIAAITFAIRKAVEYFVLDNPKMPGSRSSKLWNELLLPLAPLVNGILISVLGTKLPIPEIAQSIGGRILYGLVAGLLSGFVYRILRAMLLSKAGLSAADDNDGINQTPPSPSPYPPYPYPPAPYPPQPYPPYVSPYPPQPYGVDGYAPPESGAPVDGKKE